MAGERWQAVVLALILVTVVVLFSVAFGIAPALKKESGQSTNTGRDSFRELTFTGARGPTGPRGTTTAFGATGVTGPNGETVNTGAKGVTGIVGPQGPAGVSSDTGSTGMTGISGDTGISGVIGPQGPSGVTGMRGPTGFVGAAGSEGAGGAELKLAPVGNSSNANGATYVNGVLALQPASGTFPGVMTTGAQSFAGTKNFSTVIAPTITATTLGGTTINIPTVVASSSVQATTINGTNISSPNVIVQKQYLLQMRQGSASGQNVTNNAVTLMAIQYPDPPFANVNWPVGSTTSFTVPAQGFYQITVSVRWFTSLNNSTYYYRVVILDSLGVRLATETCSGTFLSPSSPDITLTAVSFFAAGSSFTTGVEFLTPNPIGTEIATISLNTSPFIVPSAPTVLSARFLYP